MAHVVLPVVNSRLITLSRRTEGVLLRGNRGSCHGAYSEDGGEQSRPA